MGSSASAEIVYGVQIRYDGCVSDEFESVSDFVEDIFENDLSNEDEAKYGITTEMSGYEYGDKFLVVKLSGSSFLDGRLVHAYDYGSEKFSLSDLKAENVPEWDERFKRFFADKGLPFVQPSYLLLTCYG